MIAEQIIVNILQTEMDLPVNNVWLMNQNRKIAIDEQLYIAVGMVDSQVISNTNTPYSTEEGVSELQQVLTRDNIQIDLLSKSNSALTRRWEVLAALKSVYSEQQQEENEFSIFGIPSVFVNSSSAEGGSQINRFTITVAVHTLYSKTKAITGSENYYDDFDTRVDDEQTIGTDIALIEFNINGSS